MFACQSRRLRDCARIFHAANLALRVDVSIASLGDDLAVDRAEYLDVSMLIDQVSLDYAQHPARPLSHQHVAQNLALELQVAGIEDNVADNLAQHEGVFKYRDCADALAVEYFH